MNVMIIIKVVCGHIMIFVPAMQETHIAKNCDSHFISRWYHNEVDVNV